MSKYNEKTIKQALNEVFDDMRIRGKISEARLISTWEKVLGKTIAKHTRKLYISKGTLFVYLDNPALKNELTYARERMKELLNEEAGEELVKDVVIK